MLTKKTYLTPQLKLFKCSHDVMLESTINFSYGHDAEWDAVWGDRLI